MEHLRLMTQDDLAQVLSWRNHQDVRRYMYTKHAITLEEHQRWFERTSQDPQKHLLIFQDEGVPMGFVQFSQLNSSPVADWGFYTAPDARRGAGRRLGRTALCYAFDYLKLHKVCGQVLAYNERSIHCHLSLGFQQEGRLRDQYFNGQDYNDVLCFGLLATEWQPGIREEVPC